MKISKFFIHLLNLDCGLDYVLLHNFYCHVVFALISFAKPIEMVKNADLPRFFFIMNGIF